MPKTIATGGSGPVIPGFVAGDILHLVLMPTERCNFRCTYCYEDFSNGRMDRSTRQGIRRLLERRAAGLRSLTIEWFGGEPLLELDIIEEIQTHVQGLAARYGRLRASAGATTNGYLLTPAVLRRLVSVGVGSYQISIDGSRREHDGKRMLANGRGSFDRIWENLLAARDSDLEFLFRLRVHVDRENRRALPGFLERLGSEVGGDDRFVLIVRSVDRWGGPNDAALPILEGEELAVVDELQRIARGFGLKLSETKEPEACYAAAANSFVIRSTGEIAKCTVALRHANNRVGRLRVDGTATIDNVKINGWVRGLFSGDPEELACPKWGFAEDSPARERLRVIAG